MEEVFLSEIEIVPVSFKNGLVGFCSFVFNSQLFISGVSIYSSPSSPQGFRVVFPTKLLKNKSQLDIVRPINKKTGSAIQEQIVEKYRKIIENVMKEDMCYGDEQ